MSESDKLFAKIDAIILDYMKKMGKNPDFLLLNNDDFIKLKVLTENDLRWWYHSERTTYTNQNNTDKSYCYRGYKVLNINDIATELTEIIQKYEQLIEDEF